MLEAAVPQCEPVADCELPPRRSTAPRRYNCYETFPVSEEEEDEWDKKSTRKYKRKQKCGNVESSATCSNASDQKVPDSDGNSSKDSTSNELLQEDIGSKRYGVGAYVCPECGKVLRSKDTLQRHKISHSGLKPFLCKVCDQGFSSAVSLKEHKARHENKKLYECKLCSKSFRQNSCYHRHMATHSKAFVHVCQVCNKRFSSKDYLRSHMKSHSGEKNYACDHCSKRFARVSDLNRHKILHTNARPYSCTICGLSFADSSSCRRHVKDHDSVNKFIKFNCDHCTSSFRKASLLTQHLVKKHKIVSSLEANVPDGLDIIENSAEMLQEVDVVRDQAFSDEHLLLGETTIPCPDLNENDVCNKQPTVQKHPVYEAEDCNTYLNNYNDNFLSIQTGTVSETTVLKVVAPEIDISNYDVVQDVFYSDVLQGQKHSTSLSLHDDVLAQFRADYVVFPDFQSQDYYTWLSNFNSVCKLLPFPLDVDLFAKISQVQKSIVDTLSAPSDILSVKANFKVLRTIGEDLYHVMNGHLNFVYDNLKE